MKLTAGLELWLGPVRGPLTLSPKRWSLGRDDRTVLLGAGFTKATSSAAPLFSEYTERLKASLLPLIGDHPDLRKNVAKNPKDNDPSTLAELLHDFAGRRAVAELFLAEPASADLALSPGGYSAWSSPLPPRAEGTYRTLEGWEYEIEHYHSLHLSPLHPSSPPILLGRLIAEGRLRRILSTNWDSYVELGARLVGLHVYSAPRGRDPHIPASDRGLQVYESGREVALHPRTSDDALLLKLHGGIGHVSQLLRDLARGVLTAEQVEEQLRSAFLVSVTDLTHWRDHAQWVQDAVADALRGHASLLLGVSGADPVSFRAVRARIIEWEQAARGHANETSSTLSGPRMGIRSLEPLPLVAVNRSMSNRLACMMAVAQPRGLPSIQVVAGDAKRALRGAYAWTLVQGLDRALSAEDDPVCTDIAIELAERLGAELDAPDERPSPLLDLLCDALGPNARWAAIADGRPPFAVHGIEPIRRWWYTPWFGSDGRGYERGLLQIAAFAALLSRDMAIKVDPWSGVVALSPTSTAWLHRENCISNHEQCDLVPVPWPWPPSRGVRGGLLARALRSDLHWQAGRSLHWLASPRLQILPVGDPREYLLRPDPRGSEIQLVSGSTPITTPFDWLNLFAHSQGAR